MDLEIVELLDPVGIAGSSPEVQALVLTREVAKGGDMVNQARVKNGLGELDLIFADMIIAAVEATDASPRTHNFSNKTSSTTIRKYISKNNL